MQLPDHEKIPSACKQGKDAITAILTALNIPFDQTLGEQEAKAFHILLQLIEGLSEKNERLRTEVQKLRDEINLLKGEQAKPDILSSKNRHHNKCPFFSK
ncbi:MAG: hypothetical protein QME81_14765 [bacterium]|nr:hypothetical protein [bacterium]